MALKLQEIWKASQSGIIVMWEPSVRWGFCCTIYIRETLGKTYPLNAQSFSIRQKNQVLRVGDWGRSAGVITW